MAYGTISSTLLVGMGVPPAAASAGVHAVETFTTGVSAISHVAHGNVNWRLFFRLVIPGVIGGVLGAYVLSNVAAETARPLVLGYLLAIGLYLLWRGATHTHVEKEPKIVEPLGLFGGFMDAAGGGGWGPIVTSNLMVQGSKPRFTIGTVNTAEFFLTLSISATFIATIGFAAFTTATVGLLIGGIVAAGSAAVRTGPAHPARGAEMLGVAKVDQRVQAGDGFEDDIAPFAAMTAIGAAIFDVFFTAKADGSGPAGARTDEDLGLVKEMHCAEALSGARAR